jgi:uncharacterized protein (DUF924 family)
MTAAMTRAPALPERAQALIDFWFGPEGDPDREQHRAIWFRGTPEYDEALRREFLADWEMGAAGQLDAWEATPEGALALVLLLDQVPRNIFRNTPCAYATDPAARGVAERALARGFDQEVPPAWRVFFLMPLHHSESLADQRRSIELAAAQQRGPDRPRGDGSRRRYGIPYVEVIERFGRFPHRNAILGRPSTPEEAAFLAERERRRAEPQSNASSDDDC